MTQIIRITCDLDYCNASTEVRLEQDVITADEYIDLCYRAGIVLEYSPDSLKDAIADKAEELK